MSLKSIAAEGIKLIDKNAQRHHMPLGAISYIDTSVKDSVYGISFCTDNPHQVEFIAHLLTLLPGTSSINIQSDDMFVLENLQFLYKGNKQVTIGQKIKSDIDVGNPPFYERGNSKDSRTGSKLIYDKHIKNAVANMSGRFEKRGPYITDTTWFQGGAQQGKFREWLFSSEFGLKTIIILPSDEFNVDDVKTGLCMFIGEAGYSEKISIIDYKTKEEFSADFRKVGYIVPNKELAELLPAVKTKTIYEWKRTKVQLGLSEAGEVLRGPKEVVNGTVKVLKRLLLDAEPEYYYTMPEHITDWSDSDKERFVTRYQPATGRKRWQEIAVGVIVEPGVIVPGEMNFTYTVTNGAGEKHKLHLMSKEVTAILKKTRTGKSLHTPQTVWVPYATEFNGWTDEQRTILNNI